MRGSNQAAKEAGATCQAKLYSNFELEMMHERQYSFLWMHLRP
jgi:hypothetical protein